MSMQRILLAHDCTPGSDRALDRALQLAGERRSELLVVHVQDENADGGSARRELQSELRHHQVTSQLCLEQGDPAECIYRLSCEMDCAMVLVGLPRNGLRRLFGGSTVQRLAGRLERPLLVVRLRPHGAYKHIMLACDLSARAQLVLQRSLELFPRVQLELLHAFEPAGSLDDHDLLHQQLRHLQQGPCAAFLDSCGLDQEQRQRIHLHLRPGPLAPAMAAHLAEHRVDLVILGAHEQGLLRDLLQGDQAASLLDGLNCDSLLLEPLR